MKSFSVWNCKILNPPCTKFWAPLYEILSPLVRFSETFCTKFWAPLYKILSPLYEILSPLVRNSEPLCTKFWATLYEILSHLVRNLRLPALSNRILGFLYWPGQTELSMVLPNTLSFIYFFHCRKREKQIFVRHNAKYAFQNGHSILKTAVYRAHRDLAKKNSDV